MKGEEIILSLRSKWIQERDQYPQFSREWLRLHFGVYALDEALESIVRQKVWRYSARGISLTAMLVRDEEVRPKDGNQESAPRSPEPKQN